jgi:S-DNA-T family DNA segregation ATPase FtsK/SpoIIIE
MGRSAKRKSSSSTRRIFSGIVLVTIALLLALSLAARVDSHLSPLDPGQARSRIDEISGWFGRFLAVPVLAALGFWVAALLPYLSGAIGVRLLAGRALPLTTSRFFLRAAIAALLASAVSALVLSDPAARAFWAGGVGLPILHAFQALFGKSGAVVVLAAACIATVLAFGLSESSFAQMVRSGLARAAQFVGAHASSAWEALNDDLPEEEEEEAPKKKPAKKKPKKEASKESKESRKAQKEAESPPAVLLESKEESEDEEEWTGDAAPAVSISIAEASGDEEEEAATPPVVVLPSRGDPQERPAPASTSALEMIQEIQTDPEVPYEIPPEDFLEEDSEEGAAAAHEELVANAMVLEKALRDFGVKGKVTQVQPGPVITRFEIEPAAGQKVAPIANLSDDLALALKARHIRIVAPIPGKAAVGIEIPNPRQATVRLGPLLQSSQYRSDSSPLNIALGRTISGDPFCAALDRMPHVLVAGATGAGKSVCINTMITSILYRAGPDKVRFIMIDPKMLELMTYVGLPHLVPPVVTQPKEVAKILKWVVAEMETRYRTLARSGVRSIVDYNRRQEEEGAPRLPYLVVIVDELADLMLSNLRTEIEEAIARLAQMSRAVGIHLVVATQRPSVDVITGVIKANFPSRIAFQVPTRVDSRTILDSMGAERLLGKGDMLYLGVGMNAPMRIHGSYVTTEETTDIVEWLKTRHPAPEQGAETFADSAEIDLYPRDREDDLFEESARIIVAHQQGSVSLLQRRLKVGYARAARLVDMLEEAGIVGAFTGSKAREVLIPNLEELEKKLAANRQASSGAERR